MRVGVEKFRKYSTEVEWLPSCWVSGMENTSLKAENEWMLVRTADGSHVHVNMSLARAVQAGDATHCTVFFSAEHKVDVDDPDAIVMINKILNQGLV